MSPAVPLLALAFTVGAPEVARPSTALKEGIRLYEKRDYEPAILALVRALETNTSRNELARVHVYFGLIQYVHGELSDAKSSFREALRYDQGVPVPRGAPSGARALMKRVKSQLASEAHPASRDEALRTRQSRALELASESPALHQASGLPPRASEEVQTQTTTTTASLETPDAPASLEAPSAQPKPSMIVLDTAPHDQVAELSNVVPEVEGRTKSHWRTATIGIGIAGAVAGVVVGGLALDQLVKSYDHEENAVADAAHFTTFKREGRGAIVCFSISGAAFLVATLISHVDF